MSSDARMSELTVPVVHIHGKNRLDLVLKQLNQIPNNAQKVKVNLSCYPSARPHYMVSLVTFFSANPFLDIEICRPDDKDVCSYLNRMGFYQHLGYEFDYPYTKWDPDGRFIELKSFNEENQDDVVNEITKCLARLGLSEQVQRALQFTFDELIDNACSHSNSCSNSYVCAQLFPSTMELHLAIADAGIGIPESLRKLTEYHSFSDDDLLNESIKNLVSAKRGFGAHQGQGLYKVHSLMEKSKGELYIYSNRGYLSTISGYTTTRPCNNFFWNGTILYAVIPYLSQERWDSILLDVFGDDLPLLPHLDPDDFFGDVTDVFGDIDDIDDIF